MKRYGALFLALAFIMGGCSNNSQETASLFKEDGRAKTLVAMLPVFDQSGASIGWSLSEEFIDSIRSRLEKGNQFFLATQDEMSVLVNTLQGTENPFQSDTDWIGETFQNFEFAIFTELVEHTIYPKETSGSFLDILTPSFELSLTMRVRVFDLRLNKPKVILQELISQKHSVPSPSKHPKIDPEKWKRMSFHISPTGLAHSQMTKEIAKRVGAYITVAKGG